MRIILILLVLCGSLASAAGEPVMKLTLLGTGTPIPNPSRFGPATLVEAGGKRLLFDAGRGVGIRLWQAGVPLGKVDVLFLTHFHSDHTVGIPDLWLSGWAETPYGQRQGRFKVTGPKGARELMTGLEKAYAADVHIRMADAKRSAEAIRISVTEFENDGVVFEEDGIRVVAFEVDHGAYAKPAYGYRVEYRGKAIVVSGDTRPNENVVRYGTGADILVHTVFVAHPEVMKLPLVQAIMAHHTTGAQAGAIFARARPRLAVYTHIGVQNRAGYPVVGVKDIIEQTRSAYEGPLQVGEDLMSFDVDDANVVVRPAGSK